MEDHFKEIAQTAQRAMDRCDDMTDAERESALAAIERQVELIRLKEVSTLDLAGQYPEVNDEQ